MSNTNLESELYFLMVKYLSSGPCQRASEVLRQEIEEHSLMPKRCDWHGNEHNNTFSDVNSSHPHISSDHLLKICSRIGPLLEKEIPPSVSDVCSLLGTGRQSLLRTKLMVNHLITSKQLSSRRNGFPLYPSPQSLPLHPFNIVSCLISRENSGPSSVRQTVPCKIYSRAIRYRRILGHLSSVYCVSFDRTGQYIFTGADDCLIKIWSSTDCRLLSTLRGHISEITDLAVNYENTLIAAGSCDKMIRVWCLRTTAPVTVLIGHNAQITSLKFCPLMRDENRYLVSTANDGCVCFWRWNANTHEFYPRPIKFTERHKPGSHLICSSFSSGGVFLAIGSTDNYVRVYHVTAPAGPTKILEIEQHSDDVDSVQFSNFGCRFVSGSKDGVAHIWYYERQNWHNIPLRMTERLPGSPQLQSEEMTRKLRVNMVGWTCDDVHVITSLSDHSLKIWDSNTGQLKHVLYGHDDEVFVIDTHPKDGRLFLTGGHDGRVILWDAVSGNAIKKFQNNIDGQGHGAVFDCRFSPDGLMFASTDSHGHLSLFGFYTAEPYQKVPEQVFFHTDYRPVVRDANQYVIDEQTQCAPHLMPPPFLVDIDGNPYPPQLQRLVPGRENASDDSLVPYIAVHNANGVAEVLEPVIRPDENPGPSIQQNDEAMERPTIDDMIQRLALEQDRLNQEHDYVVSHGSSHERYALHRHNQLPRSRQNQSPRGGLRRSGDVEGVRAPAPHWLSHDNVMTSVWAKRLVVKPLLRSESNKIKLKANSFADAEETHFNKERKKRPQLNDVSVSLKDAIKQERFTRRKRRIIQQRHGVPNEYGRNRYARRPDGRHRNGITDFETPEDLAALSDDSDSDFVGSGAEEWEDTSSDSSESEDTEDSEWNTHNDLNVPVNSQRKKNGNKRLNKRSSEDNDDDDKDDDQNEDDDEINEEAGPSSGRRSGRGSFGGRNKIENQRIKDKRRRQKLEEKYQEFKELPENFRPPEWLTDTIPRKFPYFPQIGDEIVYFRQGHQSYIDAVRDKKVYTMNQALKPFKMKKLTEDEVFARVVDIKYDVKPPRLVTLKLQVMNRDDNSPIGEHFSVRYHDMEDIIDFIVLRQIYDNSIERDWIIGNEFRAIIDEKWWFGRIIDQQQHDPRFPNSMFQCFVVNWASGDEEKLSPWDLEPIDESRAPSNRKDSLPITTEERLSFYRPNDDEWPPCGREAECQRIAKGLARIMEMGHAEAFAYPVDLDEHPIYGITISYPLDLSTIKSRVENQFYRRLDAIKSEVKFIETNAREFNEPGSEIVKKAKIVTALCLRFIDDPNCTDPMAIYLDIVEHHDEFDEPEEYEIDTDRDEDFGNVPTRKNPSRRKRRHSESSNYSAEEIPKKCRKRSKSDKMYLTSRSWKQQCRDLIDIIFQCEDSSPFRSPVDPIQYPNYSQLIDTPMDLTTVKEQLLTDLYDTPNDFCKDMRLIFTNSKTFNTKKKSRIYAMTIRIQNMFESRMREIISDWKSAVNHEKRLKSSKYVSDRRRPIQKIRPNSSDEKRSKRRPKSRLISPSSASTSLSPSIDMMSQPSTSGYSGPIKGKKSVSNQLQNRQRSLSPKKNVKNRSETMKRNIKRTKKVSNGNIKKRSAVKKKTIAFSDDNDNDLNVEEKEIDVKKEFDSTSETDHVKNEHMDSETEIEDEECDNYQQRDDTIEEIVVKMKVDSDATEIDENDHDDVSTHSKIESKTHSHKRKMRRKLKLTMPKRKTQKRKNGAVASRSRLKASEESEEMTSFSSESHSSISTPVMSPATSESTEMATSVSVNESEDDEMGIPRRSSRSSRGMHSRWTHDYDEFGEEYDMRRTAALGLRNKSPKQRNDTFTSRTRTRNSGQSRVKYTYDDEDYEYDNSHQVTSDANAVSSRGRVRKLKAHARHFTSQ